MGKILEFPTKPVRDWMLVEATLRGILDRTPADERAKQTILTRFRTFFDLCNKTHSAKIALPLPASMTEAEREAIADAVAVAFGEYEQWLQHYVNQLLLERLTLEIERYFDSLTTDRTD